MTIDFFTKGEILSSIQNIEKIIGCGIFAPENMGHPLLRAAFIALLIDLRDLMYKTEKYAGRIMFSDDVRTNENVRDVSDLIKYVRDALCHLDSNAHYLEPGNIRATFNVAFGKATLIKIGDFEQSSEYSDDICFFFGSQRIYLKRHVVRAFDEAKTKLSARLNE